MKRLPATKRRAPIASLTVADIRGFRNHLQKGGRTAVTVNSAIKILRVPLNLARKQGYITHSPAEGIEPLTVEATKRGTFTSKQVASLIKAAEDHWKGMILGGYYTGARLRDLSNLKWESVDLQRQTITFVQGKTKRIVEIPLHPEFERWLKRTPSPNRKSFIFPSLAGTADETSGLSAEFRMIMKKARVEGEIVEKRGEQSPPPSCRRKSRRPQNGAFPSFSEYSSSYRLFLDRMVPYPGHDARADFPRVPPSLFDNLHPMPARSSSSTRRQFLKGATAAAGSAPLVIPNFLGAASPNGKVSHAVIGCDGQGWSDLSNISSHKGVEVVALCDVDTSRMSKAAAKFPGARRYQDWRELLEKEGDRIDSVQVAIPDHMHAPVSLAAMERGKHVYCEKPLTHDVAEARRMRLAAKKAKVVTQMGNQVQSAIEYRSAVVLLQGGVIGKIKEIHAWCGAVYTGNGRPDGEDAIPETLDWDKWLGVAPVRPFKNGVYHPFNWRRWVDFGTGCLGDFGCHILDTPFKAVELTAPTSVEARVPDRWASNEKLQKENWPAWAIVEYSFPGTKYTAGDTIKVTWHDSGKQPPREIFGFKETSRKIPGSGSLFIGEGGKLLLPHVGGPQLVPYEKNKGLERPKLEGRSHYHSFVDACLGKDKTTSNFDFAGPLAEAVLLGTIANRFSGKQLKWDAEAMKIVNLAAADKFVQRSYRTGW